MTSRRDADAVPKSTDNRRDADADAVATSADTRRDADLVPRSADSRRAADGVPTSADERRDDDADAGATSACSRRDADLVPTSADNRRAADAVPTSADNRRDDDADAVATSADSRRAADADADDAVAPPADSRRDIDDDTALATLATNGLVRARDLEPLVPVMAALDAGDGAPAPAKVAALARGITAALGDEAARALCGGATSPAGVAARFFHLRRLVVVAEALRAPRS